MNTLCFLWFTAYGTSHGDLTKNLFFRKRRNWQLGKWSIYIQSTELYWMYYSDFLYAYFYFFRIFTSNRTISAQFTHMRTERKKRKETSYILTMVLSYVKYWNIEWHAFRSVLLYMLSKKIKIKNGFLIYVNKNTRFFCYLSFVLHNLCLEKNNSCALLGGNFPTYD